MAGAHHFADSATHCWLENTSSAVERRCKRSRLSPTSWGDILIEHFSQTADATDEQILEKLLALNLERAAEEAKAAAKPEVLPIV